MPLGLAQDRVCACNSTSYLLGGACHLCTVCMSTEFESVAATSTSDRTCQSLNCNVTSYAANQVCNLLTVCTVLQYEFTAATYTSDRVCIALDSPPIWTTGWGTLDVAENFPVSEAHSMGTLHADAVQNVPELSLLVSYSIGSCSSTGTCPIHVNAVSGQLTLLRPLNGTREATVTFVAFATDSRSLCHSSSSSEPTRSGCVSVKTVTIRVVYFTNLPNRKIVVLVNQPGTGGVARWSPPQLAGIFAAWPLSISNNPGSIFPYGNTTVWYNTSSLLAGNVSAQLQFLVTVQVGVDVVLQSVGHLFRANSSTDLQGTVADFLLDSTQTFGW